VPENGWNKGHEKLLKRLSRNFRIFWKNFSKEKLNNFHLRPILAIFF